ncbi:ankyrin repeat domain-containing protein SOWAHB [Oncorhynchus mykiss]|uniref:ankyrin repeat domain-containing protein SOWAHB n=1 Tax=Oncorhynchus mykiss TaxID=8022 RepID=UPI000B4EA984|nr:ankyrin repeat domain-containing protein SOWAHB [Oncorhynchus mykiss]
MATDFTQDSVLHFLQFKGGRVKNSDLLAHFKTFLRDHENQTYNRQLFKTFVNSVAVVKPEEGVSYVVLRKKCLGQVAGDIAAAYHSPKPRARQQPAPQARPRERDQSSRAPVNRNQQRGQMGLIETHFHELHVPPGDTNQLTDKVLASAGIVNNNNNVETTINYEKPIQCSSPHVPDHASPPIYNRDAPFLPSYNAAISKWSEDGSGQSFEAEWELNHKGIYISGSKLGQQSKEPKRKRSYPPPEFLYTEVKPPASHPTPVQQNAVQPQRKTSENDHRRTATAWPLLTTLEHASSSPCLSDGYSPPAAPRALLTPDPQVTRSNGNLDGSYHLHHRIPQQPRPKQDGLPAAPLHATPACQLTQSNGSLPVPQKDGVPAPVPDIQYPEEGGAAVTQSRAQTLPFPRSLLLDSAYQDHTAGCTDGFGYPEHHHQASSDFSSSHSSLSLAQSLDSRDEWPQRSPREEWASNETLSYQDLNYPGEQQRVKVHDMLCRAQEAKLLSQMHRAERRAPWSHHHSTGYLDDEANRASSWHHSTGHLHDDNGSKSIESTFLPGSDPEHHLRPPVRRISSRFRSRMCRSLGADLDQLFPEDSVSARHNRLHLLSSNLSISHSFSTPTSRTPSYRNLRREMHSGASSNKSLNGASNSGGHDSSYFHCHDLVPLETKEHDWLVKGATGTWTDIYTLFRDEPSLLTKRDFITGYTILHWIAKHGDHRVLNTLWYGVNKAGLKLDVDVKTTCGYTPLHLAAIHGNNKMIRLLVYKFRANVSLRDTSGKKAWQYLGRTGPKDLLQMLGAPHCWTSTGGSSTPSGERPRRPAATSATVKKSMSITGFLKHKTLVKFPGWEGSQSPESFV